MRPEVKEDWGRRQTLEPSSMSGTVAGTVTATDVLAIPVQGITAADFAALTTLLLSNATYANIRTTN